MIKITKQYVLTIIENSEKYNILIEIIKNGEDYMKVNFSLTFWKFWPKELDKKKLNK